MIIDISGICPGGSRNVLIHRYPMLNTRPPAGRYDGVLHGVELICVLTTFLIFILNEGASS
jgi:hypothetical protein